MAGLRPRWTNHRFGRWIARQGVQNVVLSLQAAGCVGVSRHAVYKWVSGRRAPSTDHLEALIRVSGGALRYSDIFAARDRSAGGGDPCRTS